jgi:hypothetical protein
LIWLLHFSRNPMSAIALICEIHEPHSKTTDQSNSD